MDPRIGATSEISSTTGLLGDTLASEQARGKIELVAQKAISETKRSSDNCSCVGRAWRILAFPFSLIYRLFAWIFCRSKNRSNPSVEQNAKVAQSDLSKQSNFPLIQPLKAPPAQPPLKGLRGGVEDTASECDLKKQVEEYYLRLGAATADIKKLVEEITNLVLRQTSNASLPAEEDKKVKAEEDEKVKVEQFYSHSVITQSPMVSPKKTDSIRLEEIKADARTLLKVRTLLSEMKTISSNGKQKVEQREHVVDFAQIQSFVQQADSADEDMPE